MIEQVLATVKAALVAQLVGYVTTLAAGDTTVRTDYLFDDWLLSDQMNPAGTPTIVVRPQSGRVALKYFTEPTRDSRHAVEIIYAIVSPVPTVIQNNITKNLAGVAQVLDGLVEFSQANGGTIQNIEGELEVRYGDFEGLVATQSGFVVTLIAMERSTI